MVDAVPVTVYTREHCHLCEEATETIEAVAADEGVEVSLDLIDVDEEPSLREEYGDRVPYVFVDGRPAFKYRVDRPRLRRLLTDA